MMRHKRRERHREREWRFFGAERVTHAAYDACASVTSVTRTQR